MNIRFDSKLQRFECLEDGVWKSITQGVKNTSIVPTSTIDRYRVEVSLTCNLKCKYCVVHMNNVSQQNTIMSIKTAQKIVKRFNKEVGAKGSIFIMGGEPLVNLSVVKYIVENAKGQTIIFTNALNLTEEIITFFLKHDTYILTSLDGYNIEQNKKRFWPQVQKNYNKVLTNIKLAIQKGCKVGVSCLLHKDNIEDAENIATFFCNELNARSMSFAYPHSTVSHSEESDFDFSAYTEQMKKLYNFSKNNKVYIDQIGKIISPLYYNYVSKVGCKAGTTQRTFYPNGEETICTKIDTVEYFDIDDYIKDLPFRNSECSSCIGQYICSGECPWDYTVARLHGKKHDRICKYRKELISYIINDICNELSVANNCDEAKGVFDSICYPMVNNYN